jgi:hypothetical protein
MGAQRSELADIHALLHTLQHQPFGGEQHMGQYRGKEYWILHSMGCLPASPGCAAGQYLQHH